MKKEKIIFLDIDGVILPRKYYFHPENTMFLQQLKNKEKKHSTKENAEVAKFDQTIIALINRLCEKTGAKIVPHTNWRRTFGIEETINKLIEEGIKKENLHKNASCHYRMTSCKLDDIHSWMYQNRTTKIPEKPKSIIPNTKGYDKKEVSKYNKKLQNHGYDYLIIDDEYLGYGNDNQIKTDFDEGFTLNDYKIACAYFGNEDKEIGVIKVDKKHLKKIKKHFRNKIDMMEWLHGNSTPYINSRAFMLNKSYAEHNAQMTILYGRKKTGEELHKEYLQKFWEELNEKHPIPKKEDKKPLFNDF